MKLKRTIKDDKNVNSIELSDIELAYLSVEIERLKLRPKDSILLIKLGYLISKR